MLTFLVSGCSVSREQRKIFVGYPALQDAVNRSTSGQVPDDRQSKDGDQLPPAHVDHIKALHFVPATIEYGEPRPIIDSVGWMFGLPRRILLWDQRVDNHQVSKETVTAVGEYLATNRIDGVAIRVNQYAPLDEWRRLRTNQQVGAGWRYTFGLGHWVAYTLFPGRIWGGDWYNPYSNTVHLYSDVPQLGLVETAYAKDIASQEFPGTYATVQTLPIIALWHETKATNDVVSYIALNLTWHGKQSKNEHLSP